MMILKKNVAISESGFVFDPTTGDSFSLNPVGQEILELIKQGKNQNEITGLIISKYDVDQNSFERYFIDFLSTLKQMQLVEEHE
ncbi:HPr-rel-A system PqqD family peptide chaperone [bacterium]|nr:MAG: HPr-rel-A system PqqD family peptide chaperone [bacterium]